MEVNWEMSRNFQNNKNNYDKLNDYIKKCHELLIQHTDISVPILKYFHSQRNTSEKQKSTISTKRYLSEQLKTYDDSFVKSLEFDKLIHWYIEEENIENREKVSREDFKYQNPYLSVVRNA